MAQGLLAGKHGVVLGVANEKSIAWGCAQACAEQGAALTFNYLDGGLERRVRNLAETLSCETAAYPCDLTDDTQVDAFFSEIGKTGRPIDFLIHSVAYAEREDLKNPFIETPRLNFQLALDVSAYSLVAAARGAAPLMPEGGSIVTMSYYGAEKIIPNYNVMGVAKAALEASARYLAYDLGARGVRVNCLSAGPLRTLSSSAISGMRSMLKAAGDVTPMRRNITHDDVAGAAVYLVSDLASGVTGEVLHVDNGYHAMGMFEGTSAQE